MLMSRNPEPFLRRCGLLFENEAPAPRIDIRALTVVSQPQTLVPPQRTLVRYEGAPAPDRGLTKPWPYGS